MIRKIQDREEKKAIARSVLESLTDWFEVPEAREKYIRESAEMNYLVNRRIDYVNSGTASWEEDILYLKKNEGDLCETCRTRMTMNPLRVLDCKNDTCRKVASGAPKTIDYLCEECAAHFDKLRAMLDASNIEYVVDPHIVRGLDYYTKTVFEFIAEGIGAQSTVCGGGRYDGLVKELGGPALPACGFGMGITRLLLAMDESGVEIPSPEAPRLYIASLGEAAQIKASAIAAELKRTGIYAEFDAVGRSLKAQRKYADKIGAAKVLILGDTELETGRAALRTMTGSIGENDQIDIEIARVAEYI